MEMNRSSGQSVISFQYNADGIRTSKTVDGVKHTYLLSGSQIVGETWGNNLLIYLYDESGSPIGMQYRNSSYDSYDFDSFYFEKNLQGDIVAVYNESGTKVLTYTYDAWGNHTMSWYSVMGTDLYAQYNPFRYRGYYYDTETKLYYLQSRYYDPYAGRFLNADGLIYTGTGLLGYNMYAYCNNNPISFVDSSGEWPVLVIAVIAVIVLSLSGCRNSYGNTTPNESMSPDEYDAWVEDNYLLQYGRDEEFSAVLLEGLYEANQKSKSSGREIAGFVYKRHGGYYQETGADIRFSNRNEVVYKIDLPNDAELIAVFHTHPIDKSREDAVFSIADYEHCKKHNVDSYVIDPNDNIFMISPDAPDHTHHKRIK